MGATALMLASEEGHTEIVASLLAHADVQINMQDNVRNVSTNVDV